MGFNDVLDANAAYRSSFVDSKMAGTAAKGLAVLTCIDSRIDPLAIMGLAPGDAKIIRNAGARVTDDALRSLVLATNLLGVRRICVVQHTECAMAGTTEDALRERIETIRGRDAAGWRFLPTTDQLATLDSDLEVIRKCELLGDITDLGGFLLDVHTGQLTQVR